MQFEHPLPNPNGRSTRSSSLTPQPPPLSRQSLSQRALGGLMRRRSSVSTPALPNRSQSLSQILVHEARSEREAQDTGSVSVRGSRSSLRDGQPRIDTPEASRASAPRRASLEDARRALETVIDTVMDPLRTQAGKPAGDILRLMDGLLGLPHQALAACATGMLTARSTDALMALLTGLAVVRSKVLAGEQREQLMALDACARALLCTRLSGGAAPVLASMEARAADIEADDDTVAEQLQAALAVLPDETLLLAANSQQGDLRSLALGQAAIRRDRTGQRALGAMAEARWLTEPEARPASVDAWITILSGAARRVETHERCCALSGKSISREVTASRATLGTALRGLLDRGRIPLHAATPAQRQALCATLARLGVPLTQPDLERQAQTAFMAHGLDAWQDGRLAQALTLLQAAQAHLMGMAAVQAPGPGLADTNDWCANLRAQLLDELLHHLPAARLAALASAMDNDLSSAFLAAMSQLSRLPQVGEPLGRELAGRHRDLLLMREAVARVQGQAAPARKIALQDAARNLSACAELRKAFALELHADAKGVHIRPRNGPVGADTQAVFASFFKRDAKAAGRPCVMVNGMALDPRFIQSLRSVRCSVFNRHTGSTDVLNVRGKTDAALVDTLQERSGASAAQMIALSRLFDADSRLDGAMLSHAGALRLNDGPVVLPVLSQASRRESSVDLRCDDKGLLRLRFRTQLSGIAGFIPIESQSLAGAPPAAGQMRQMRPAAPGHDAAAFTHEVVISRDGHCSLSPLQRNASLQQAARGRNDGYVLQARDLLANADMLRSLEQAVQNTLPPAATPAPRFTPASPAARATARAQAILDQARAVLDAGRAAGR